MNKNVIEFDWFHKPSFSGKFMNFHSLHLLTQKKGVIIEMLDRTLLLSHPKYYKKHRIYNYYFHEKLVKCQNMNIYIYNFEFSSYEFN